MKGSLIIAVLLVVGGICGWIYASAIPVYTDPDAPGRLSLKLGELPSKEGFRAWHEELPKFETKHKMIADGSRGSIALGIGMAIAAGILYAYKQHPSVRRKDSLFFFWMGMWGITQLT